MVDVVTVPKGAQVRLAGELRGSTPIQLALPRSSSGVELKLSLPGYRSVRTRWKPDKGALIKLVLRKKSKERRHEEPLPEKRPPPEFVK